MSTITVPTALIKAPIKNADLRVLLAMTAEADDGVCYLLQSDLAEASGVSVNTIARSIRRLVAHRLVEPLGYNPDTRTHAYVLTDVIPGGSR